MVAQLVFDEHGAWLFRCAFCVRELQTNQTVYNEAVWVATDSGWGELVPDKEERGSEYVSVAQWVCPACKEGSILNLPWEAWCETCDDAQRFSSEDEARKWERRHECDLDPWTYREMVTPEVRVTSPDIRRQERARLADALRRQERERAAAEQLQRDALAWRSNKPLVSRILKARASRWRNWLLRMAGV